MLINATLEPPSEWRFIIPWCDMNISLGETTDAIRSQEYQQTISIGLTLIPFFLCFYAFKISTCVGILKLCTGKAFQPVQYMEKWASFIDALIKCQ